MNRVVFGRVGFREALLHLLVHGEEEVGGVGELQGVAPASGEEAEGEGGWGREVEKLQALGAERREELAGVRAGEHILRHGAARFGQQKMIGMKLAQRFV